MPELPEVQTTVNGLRTKVIGLRINGVWTNYDSAYFKGSNTIKDPAYFKKFKQAVVGRKIISADRRAKNILIGLGGKGAKTILVHMKMTGHLMYGKYSCNQKNKKDPWKPVGPGPLQDSFNRHIRFVISFSNKMHLVLSDVRRFAKVTLIDSSKVNQSDHLKYIGPEPLEDRFTIKEFRSRINLKKNNTIKQVLLDQSIIAGIGNIYADESLWRTNIHPTRKISKIRPKEIASLFTAIKQTLSRGIDFGGDSTSDYRNILGEKGSFQEKHRAYRRTGTKCYKKGCRGTIAKIIIGGRSTHFCDTHQK